MLEYVCRYETTEQHNVFVRGNVLCARRSQCAVSYKVAIFTANIGKPIVRTFDDYNTAEMHIQEFITGYAERFQPQELDAGLSEQETLRALIEDNDINMLMHLIAERANVEIHFWEEVVEVE